jgi:hypothetical protein
MYWDWKEVGIDVLIGKTLKSVTTDNDGFIEFECEDGTKYRMFHEQDCCESVSIEDITGDLYSLVGHPITMAEEVSKDGDETDYGTSTWTFYKLANINEYVTIRWYGESNGYYSESVSFKQIIE